METLGAFAFPRLLAKTLSCCAAGGEHARARLLTAQSSSASQAKTRKSKTQKIHYHWRFIFLVFVFWAYARMADRRLRLGWRRRGCHGRRSGRHEIIQRKSDDFVQMICAGLWRLGFLLGDSSCVFHACGLILHCGPGGDLDRGCCCCNGWGRRSRRISILVIVGTFDTVGLLVRAAATRLWLYCCMRIHGLFSIRFVVILVNEVRLVILFLFEAIIGHRAALASTRRHRLMEGEVGGGLGHFVVVGLGHWPAAVETAQERLKGARETQKLSKEKYIL